MEEVGDGGRRSDGETVRTPNPDIQNNRREEGSSSSSSLNLLPPPPSLLRPPSFPSPTNAPGNSTTSRPPTTSTAVPPTPTLDTFTGPIHYSAPFFLQVVLIPPSSSRGSKREETAFARGLRRFSTGGLPSSTKMKKTKSAGNGWVSSSATSVKRWFREIFGGNVGDKGQAGSAAARDEARSNLEQLKARNDVPAATTTRFLCANESTLVGYFDEAPRRSSLLTFHRPNADPVNRSTDDETKKRRVQVGNESE